jgi:hypothetical protein
MTLPHAVILSFLTALDLRHAVIAYGSVLGCAASLWLVAVVVNSIADRIKQARLEHRQFVIRRLMEGDGAKR